MSSISRFLSRALRRQAPEAALPRTQITTSIRNAQTEAAPSPLKSTPPPHPFQHARQPATQTHTPNPQINTDPLSSHPLLHTLRLNKTLKETRPHLTMPQTHRAAHLVAGALSGTTKLTTPPYLFLSRRPSLHPNQGTHDAFLSTATALFHPGPHLCGHPGFIHGGFLSVMFDEVFAHCVAQSFKSGTGMTANLNVDFRKPAVPDRVFVLRAETVRVEGRKAWVEGGLRMLPADGGTEEGVLVAEARALFVEPRFAESMVPVYRN
ncbi:hypothetical protein BDV12DRAFT_205624 [Aspergillus spectabilis]